MKTAQKKKRKLERKKAKEMEEEDPGVYVTLQGEIVPNNVYERTAEARRHAGNSIWTSNKPYGVHDWKHVR